MKTAMQFMLSYIEAIQNDDFNSDIEYIKENCIQLLEKEKKDLEYTFTEAKSIGYSHSNVNFDEFYKEHFKP